MPQRKEYMKKYRNTPQYKESQKKWRSSPEGKLYLKNYRNSPEEKEKRQKYDATSTAKEIHRRYWLKHKYGIDLEEYDRMFQTQRGRCAICFEIPQGNKKLVVDHDHKCCPGRISCGKCIRGLLCNKCNLTLGSCNDSTLLLQETIRYIEDHKKK